MHRVVQLFEHETIRVGRAMRSRDGRGVELQTRHFDALVRFNDANGQRYFTVGHQSIRLSQFVGYVEVGDPAIEILPKADRAGAGGAPAGQWRDALLAMLAASTGLQLESPAAASQRTRRGTLLELVVARFLDEVEVLLHQGLAKGYRAEESNGPSFRGRLMMNEHIRANAARADRFYVSAQTYDRDVPVNRIVGAALDAACTLTLSPSLTARAASTRARFPDVGPLRVTPTTFERQRLSRSTARYAHAITLAQMLLERAAPHLRTGPSQVFALLFDMNILWERYIASVFRKAAGPELSVSCQERHSFWRSEAHERRVRPDIVVRQRSTNRVVVVADTKWKLLGEGPPADTDLQQMFVYNELLEGALALPVYPGVDGARSVGGGYHRKQHRCDTLHLELVGAAGWRPHT